MLKESFSHPYFVFLILPTTTKGVSAGMRAILKFGCSRIGFVFWHTISKPWLDFVPLTILGWFVRNRASNDSPVVGRHHITLLLMRQSEDAAYLTPLIHRLEIFFSNEKGQGKRRLGYVPKLSSEPCLGKG